MPASTFLHPQELYPGLPVRLSTAYPQTAYRQVRYARVWYVSERTPGAVMLVTWQTRRSVAVPLLVNAAWLIAEHRPADPPEMPDWARVEAVGA